MASSWPNLRNPRERRALAHMRLAAARESGAVADFLTAHNAIEAAGGTRKGRASGYIGALLNLYPPMRPIYEAVELVQNRTDLPFVPHEDQLISAVWQRSLGTPGYVPTGRTSPMRGHAVVLGYNAAKRLQTVEVQIDMGDDYNFAVGLLQVKDEALDLCGLRRWGSSLEEYAVAASNVLAAQQPSLNVQSVRG